MGHFLNAHQHRILRAMDIPVWVVRGTEEKSPDPCQEVPDRAIPDQQTPDREVPDRDITAVWNGLEKEVAGCTECPLHQTRTRTVFGVGNRTAQWMIIGEAPGADEDRQGEPFVGRAGLLLNEMLRAVGLARSDVYIANILKCRPPGNRDPGAGEVAACADYLSRQIELVRPQLILAVGRIAAQNLLDRDQPVGKLRGVVHEFGPSKIPVVVTYHPAYLLRSPGQKRKAWSDLCLARGVADS
jgi:uracil-DNA glycosylase family 4